MNSVQLGFDLAFAAAERAADHAERLHDGWKERAFAAFKAYASEHEQFATEDVIAASLEVPKPFDMRAWGHIARRAKREGVIVKSDKVRTTNNAHAHSRSVAVWISLICEAVAA